jgi:DNA-directed RNA polymerase subunit K/omega
MMITPSIEQLTQGKFNRYALVIATAKCARIVTDEYVAQRELAEKNIADKKTEKTIASQIDKDIRDNKAVENAVQRLYKGEFNVIVPEEVTTEQLK